MWDSTHNNSSNSYNTNSRAGFSFSNFSPIGSSARGSNPFFQQQQQRKRHNRSSSSMSDWDGLQRDQQPQQQEVDLKLSLEDLFNGVTKKLKVTRRVFDSSGHPAQQPAQEVLEVQVKPGWKEGGLTSPGADKILHTYRLLCAWAVDGYCSWQSVYCCGSWRMPPMWAAVC
eukprot:GHUV01032127.1.p1 GENE.GHUV01032127.1~~GHUV01032127.1.p1  ORF type:complete len:171 (-),score=58.44 GHUV01032127.1:224-736(-)